MKLLFDQNLSPSLVDRLIDVYPNSSHVALLGLDRRPDEDLWNYARANDYVIVTKDADLNDLSLMRGFPPKVIWLRLELHYAPDRVFNASPAGRSDSPMY